MHIDYLIRMANDIAAFFSADPEEDAAENIRQHLKRYWDPRMKAQIVAHYNETRGASLEGPVLAAVKLLAEEPQKKEVAT
jgi:formate dehydrogenase subunit delta